MYRDDTVHKNTAYIPQLDGVDDTQTFKDKSFQTEDLLVKNSEVQTESSDTGVTVKRGKSDALTLPPGTVILRYKESTAKRLEEVPLDYPVMSSPATMVYHPVWGLGEYLDSDEEHIFYKFKGNEVHTGGIVKL